MYVTRSLFISFYWFLCLFLTRLWRHDGKRITLFFPFPAHLHFNEQSLIFYAAACGLKALFIVIWEWKAEKLGRPRQWQQQLGVASASLIACRGQSQPDQTNNQHQRLVGSFRNRSAYEYTRRCLYYQENIYKRILWNKSVPIPALPASCLLAGGLRADIWTGNDILIPNPRLCSPACHRTTLLRAAFTSQHLRVGI